MVTLPGRMLNLPPSCSNTAPFLDESVLSKRASGYFLLKYIPVFLGKVETDRDQENHFPPRAPVPLSSRASQGRGHAPWRVWRPVVVAWNWGAVTNFSFSSSPPPKPQKPLKAQCKPALPGRARLWGGERVGLVWPASLSRPRPHLPRAAPLQKPDPVIMDHLSLGPLEEVHVWGHLNPGQGLSEGAVPLPPSSIKK